MVKLVCYNIEYCEGMEGLWYQYLQFWKVLFPPKGIDQKMVNELKKLNPDVLALVEVDIGSFRAKKDEVKFFSDKLNMPSIIEKVKYPMQGWLKLFHHVPILNKQANGLISKYNFSDIKYHLFNEGTKRVVIEATIECPKKVTLLLAHLALGKSTRKQQLEELAKIVNSIKNPVILMGDFNTFNGINELHNLLKETHLQDMVDIRKYSTGFTQPTWHPSRRLDYVLTSKQIKVNSFDVLNYHFSDHMPLFIDFDI